MFFSCIFAHKPCVIILDVLTTNIFSLDLKMLHLLKCVLKCLLKCLSELMKGNVFLLYFVLKKNYCRIYDATTNPLLDTV